MSIVPSPAAASNFSRLSGVWYPSDYGNPEPTVAYGYGASGSVDDLIGRASSLTVDGIGTGEALVEYDWIGMGEAAAVRYPVPGVGLDRTRAHLWGAWGSGSAEDAGVQTPAWT